MAQIVNVIVSAEDRQRLAAIISDRSRPLKHIQRARMILCSAERLNVLDVSEAVGISRPAVWRWQARYAEQGVEGLLRDKTKALGRAPLPTAKVAEVLELSCSEPPDEVTHLTGRAVAKIAGVSLRAVRLDQTRQRRPRPNQPIACPFRLSQCTRQPRPPPA